MFDMRLGKYADILDLFQSEETPQGCESPQPELKQHETLFLAALSNSKLLKKILDSYSKETVLQVINDANKSSKLNSLLHLMAIRVPADGIELILSHYPTGERLEVLKTKDYLGRSVMHYAVGAYEERELGEPFFNTEAITAIFSSLENEEERLTVLTEKALQPGERGLLHLTTPLHYAMQCLEYLQYLASFFSKETFHRAINTVGSERSLIYFARGSLESAEFVLSFLSEDEQQNLVNTLDNEGGTGLHCAAKYPKLLKRLLEIFPQDERVNKLKEKDSRGYSVLYFIIKNFGSFQVLQEILSREQLLQIFEEKYGRGKNIFHHCAENDSEVFEALLTMVPDSECLLKFKEMDSEGKTVLHYARYDSVIAIILKFYPIAG